MSRPESGMRSKHGFELLQNLFAQCDQLFVIRQWHSESPPQSLIHLVRCLAQPSLACHAIAFGDGGSRRTSNEGGSWWCIILKRIAMSKTNGNFCHASDKVRCTPLTGEE